MQETQPTTVEGWFAVAPWATAVVVILMLAFTGILFYAFARMLLNAVASSANVERPVTMLMWILGVLSIVALIGGLFTGSEQAFTITATGVGAFAGALTARVQALIPAEVPEPPDQQPPTGGDPGMDEDRL